jgi:hypothetical protein
MIYFRLLGCDFLPRRHGVIPTGDYLVVKFMCHLNTKTSSQDFRRNQLLVGHFYEKCLFDPRASTHNFVCTVMSLSFSSCINESYIGNNQMMYSIAWPLSNGYILSRMPHCWPSKRRNVEIFYLFIYLHLSGIINTLRDKGVNWLTDF